MTTLLLAALLSSPAFALTPAEEAALARGEVVLHTLPATRPRAVRIEAWVDVGADGAATWRALTDYKAREASSDVLTGFTVYVNEPSRTTWPTPPACTPSPRGRVGRASPTWRRRTSVGRSLASSPPGSARAEPASTSSTRSAAPRSVRLRP